ncbi:DNA cytosine methyltransferase [Bradyrhizobium zhanjiangense]|uniref:DNA (cytosine-5-)-methyltransferase n=1 Tax=Bradyrhizobium zhanjiangense TaxID=1325107 RepID=A0A4Q0Q5V6_9BRAD|nr:DNA cytosine methyltransferase [Bradyrhizobium zhanjiangense]RXG84482.1 DNA cytosine methyltransferase [Bradyrhizobium zhanjiangense]
MTTPAIRQKIARLAAGGRPRVLDLFSGCGGISLGFHAAGFEIAAAIEHDPDAAKSHGMNFHKSDNRHWKARDITKTKPAELTKELDLGHPALAFDVIVGGPPCQAFARVGRSKLREVADHPEAFRHDDRAELYIDYLQYVEACSPLVVLMENVPDMLNHGGHNIAEEVCEVLSSRGYVCGYTLLNAALYGVPQMRERMFLLAYHKGIAEGVSFPAPTHWIELPAGYDGSRAVALKLLANVSENERSDHYTPPPPPKRPLPPAVTAAEALGDLPALDARKLLAEGMLKRGARRFDQPLPLALPDRLPDFAHQMRNWQGFEGAQTVADHVIRYLPRDYPLFARLEPGDQYPEAIACAEKMFEEALAAMKAQGNTIRKNSPAWKMLRASIIPPYDPGKFPNKWRKMEADKPSRTLMAHLGKDSYSHIHYDSAQARTISVREAARLQSFPDGFVFAGTMNPAFRQIGNAVPPLLSKALAAAIRAQLDDALQGRTIQQKKTGQR